VSILTFQLLFIHNRNSSRHDQSKK